MILDGRAIAKEILLKLKVEVSKLSFQPVFCDVLVGDDAASLSYVKIKGKSAEEVGLVFKLVKLPAGISEEELIAEISRLNKTPDICGLIVQLPLPLGLNRQTVLDSIDPAIDVDCLGSENMNKFYTSSSTILPPTAGAVLELVSRLPEELQNGKFAVVGQGQLVGKPATHLLRNMGKQVLVANSLTENLVEVTGAADVLISGAGKPGLITGELIRQGAAVVDAGTAEMNGAISGDVNFESVVNKASYLTPVPGGVGPVTVAKLLENVVQVAKLRTTKL